MLHLIVTVGCKVCNMLTIGSIELNNVFLTSSRLGCFWEMKGPDLEGAVIVENNQI